MSVGKRKFVLLRGPKVRSKLPALAAQPRAFSSLLSLPSPAQSVIKAFRRQGIGSADVFNTARFLLSRIESFSALLQLFQIFRGRAERDCVFHFVPATDSPETRFSVMAAVVLSGCLCQSRKDPYLPLETQCVRLLPRPTGLPPYGICRQFPHPLRGRENRRQTP